MTKSVYEMITDRIIEELNKGNIPWHKPWTGTNKGAYSRSTGKPYSLLNQMLLKHIGEYLTFNEAKKAGGHIRKGEKSEFVCFWKLVDIEEATEDGKKEKKCIPYLRYYNVFHISQCEDIEPKYKEDLEEVEPITEAERIKKEYSTRENIEIKELLTNEAFYSPSRDYIQVPRLDQYTNVEEFYSTLFHEMTHSTGHKARLDRLETSLKASFGSETYSKEELVAEIGSATLMNTVGIETPKSFKNSSAYIQSWLQVLKSDTKFIVSAASKADKAVKYILGE